MLILHTPALAAEITHNSNIMKRLLHSVMQNVSIFNVLFSDKADTKIKNVVKVKIDIVFLYPSFFF